MTIGIPLKHLLVAQHFDVAPYFIGHTEFLVDGFFDFAEMFQINRVFGAFKLLSESVVNFDDEGLDSLDVLVVLFADHFFAGSVALKQSHEPRLELFFLDEYIAVSLLGICYLDAEPQE